MTASARSSLRALLQQAKRPLESNPGRRVDRPTDLIRIIYWYRGLSLRLKTQSHYEVGKRIEPAAYWVTEDGRSHYHRNKWSKYAIGKHRPNMGLIQRADAICPGSAIEINHVLWKMLRQRPTGRVEIEKLEAGLCARARQILLRWETQCIGTRGQVNEPFARQLQMLDCLDSFAAMQLQCERAWLAGDSEVAFEWVRRIYAGFFVHGVELLNRGITRPLMDLIDMRLFSVIVHRGAFYRARPQDYFVDFSFIRCWTVRDPLIGPARPVHLREKMVSSVLRRARQEPRLCSINPFDDELDFSPFLRRMG